MRILLTYHHSQSRTQMTGVQLTFHDGLPSRWAVSTVGHTCQGCNSTFPPCKFPTGPSPPQTTGVQLIFPDKRTSRWAASQFPVTYIPNPKPKKRGFSPAIIFSALLSCFFSPAHSCLVLLCLSRVSLSNRALVSSTSRVWWTVPVWSCQERASRQARLTSQASGPRASCLGPAWFKRWPAFPESHGTQRKPTTNLLVRQSQPVLVAGSMPQKGPSESSA